MPDDARNDDAGSAVDADPPPDADRTREQGDSLPLDTLLGLFTDERRRHLLSYLTDRPDTTVPVDDLTEAVIEREWPEPGAISHRERVEIDLHHVHLPKLADVGAIEYDPVAGTVRYVGPAVLADVLATVDAIDEER